MAANPTIMDKSTRYDRQLRLWAQDGQTRLEKSHVCLVNATSTGAEILKNLVLPGIGSFTIIDTRVVEDDDLSGNFFLESLNLGQSIAAAMCENLGELNPNVLGVSVQEELEVLVQDPGFWSNFTTVVASERIDSLVLLQLKQLLWEKGIPLLLVSTCGFYGTVQIISKETTIVETHDPSKLFDLRIDRPWPELQAYADSFVMDELDDTEHAHVPYVIIFIKALREWKLRHEGNPPLNYAEKKLFRSEFVEGMSRDIRTEANFMEASQSIHRALQVTAVPDSVQKLFRNDIIADPNLNLLTPPFWLYVRALKDFVAANNNQMPLPGNLPDMASKTSNYVNLQNIFRAKALDDQQRFKDALLAIYAKIGLPDLVPLDESILSFCKNAAFLFVSQGSPFAFSDAMKKEVMSGGKDDSHSNTSNLLAIHFGILALHEWLKAGLPDGFESYLSIFQTIVSDDLIIPKTTLKTLKELFLHQTTRYHNISSLIGGVAAQEILKISTEQYIPLDNLYVFDGISSTSSKWKI